MINTRPDVHLDGLYNQSMTAKVLQVDRHTIKRYEKRGIISFKTRKTNSQKVTTGKQIVKCWEACFL